MRIIVHDYSGHPFQIQLSRYLALRGHTVRHVFSESFLTPKGALTKREGDPDGLEIRGIRLREDVDKTSFTKRRKQDIEYGRLFVEQFDEFRPDILISGNTPLDAQKIILSHCKQAKTKFIFWVQDLYSVAISKIVSKRIPVLGSLIGRRYIRLEIGLLRQSDGIVLITDDFVPLLKEWGIDKKFDVIPNWAPLEEIQLLPKDNAWAKEHGLDDKLCLLYSGTLGFKHNPSLLLELARAFKDDPSVRVVVISEGQGADWLKEAKAEEGRDNLLIYGFQPFEQMSSVLASADTVIAILEKDAGVFSVPSKVLTYMCAGKPLLLSVPRDNLAAKIVSENRAGWVADPDDTPQFLDGAKQLVGNETMRRECGANARRYAEQTFDIQKITDQFEEILTRIHQNGTE